METTKLQNVIARFWKRYGGAQRDVIPKFSFCEPITAIGTSPWHIRRLTDKGTFLGGGVDTQSLCDREMAWDLDVPITEFKAEYCCSKCAEVFYGDI